MPFVRRLLAPLPLLLLVLLVTLIRFDRPLIRGDGVAYLAWADTLLIDHDIDLTNQVEKLRFVNDESKVMYDESQQKWVNVFPFGVAIIQAPFYLMGHTFTQNDWLNINPTYFQEHQGVELPYSLFVMFGANILALASAIFAWHLARRVCDPMTAALVAYVVFVGSPILYYSTVSPMHSHNGGAFGMAAFLYVLMRLCWDDKSKTPIPYTAFLLGLLAGITILIRWQMALAFIPAWFLLAYERRWRVFWLAGITTVIVILPLPFVWQAMYGQWFLVPYDAAKDTTFLVNPLVGAGNVLWHTLKHSPILFLCIPGFFALWRINRRWTLLCAGMIGLQVAINGAAFDWWAGESYGMRRMSELYAVYVLLIGVFCGAVVGWLRPRFGRNAVRVVRGALLLSLIYIFLYLLSFFYYTWTHPSRLFHADPDVMISYFLKQEDSGRDKVFRWQLLDSALAQHVGPRSWGEPGP